jgi:hypothetical protein
VSYQIPFADGRRESVDAPAFGGLRYLAFLRIADFYNAEAAAMNNMSNCLGRNSPNM